MVEDRQHELFQGLRGGAEEVGRGAAGERAAAIYSLTGSAQRNGLDPEAHLRDVPARIADRPITRLTARLLWNIGHPQATV